MEIVSDFANLRDFEIDCENKNLCAGGEKIGGTKKKKKKAPVLLPQKIPTNNQSAFMRGYRNTPVTYRVLSLHMRLSVRESRPNMPVCCTQQ